MAEVKGRSWPADIPFTTNKITGEDGQTYVREGFVCESRAGDFAFKDIDCHGTRDPSKVDTLEFICPRTSKYCGAILVGHLTKPAINPSWQWDGNFEAPTLTPSVNCVSGCGWHGFLKAGVWTD